MHLKNLERLILFAVALVESQSMAFKSRSFVFVCIFEKFIFSLILELVLHIRAVAIGWEFLLHCCYFLFQEPEEHQY